jgi:TPR repeat protein
MRRLALVLCLACGCAVPTRILAGDSDMVRKLKHDCAHDAKPCVVLGLAYYDGIEVKKNVAWARDLFEDACDLGVAAGCNDLGNMYLEGKGVERDVDRARNLIEAACRAKDEVACQTLAKIPTRSE